MWTIPEESKQQREDIKLSVGEGWGHLLDALFETLDFIAQDDFLKETYIAQVKEKFGTLRFYIGSGTDEQFAAIRMAEHMSGYVCEGCGNPGKNQSDGGWWVTLCVPCLKARHKRRKKDNWKHRWWSLKLRLKKMLRIGRRGGSGY